MTMTNQSFLREAAANSLENNESVSNEEQSKELGAINLKRNLQAHDSCKYLKALRGTHTLLLEGK